MGEANTNKALRVEGLGQRFGALEVLSSVSFALAEGEFAAIVGPSGCGKTVLLRTLAGLQPVGSGVVSSPPERIAYAFQKSPLFPWLGLEENVHLCMRGDARSSAERTELIRHYFQVAGLAGFERELPGRISLGMRQKVNVIRAFCSGRAVILMDEPFASLDFPARRELQQLTLDLWREERKTILFVTHDIDEALLLAGRVLVFSPRPGRILRELAIPKATPDFQILRESKAYVSAHAEIAALLLGGGR